MNPRADPYARLILAAAPRVLSRMDRESSSPTAGCGDRLFWAWKFVDFPGSRFQESLCVLSYLYATPIPDSPYHGSAPLLAWIRNGLRYRTGLRHRDGSFDEAYPFERSLAATSFSSFYVGEALGFLGDALPAADRELATRTLTRAGDWLTKNDEDHGFLSNHLAAAAAALLHAHRVSGEDRFEKRSRHFLEKIMDHQSEEGWYDEYGGADPGYQTHGSFYLVRCHELAGYDDLGASLDRAMDFMARCVHPDGSIGGEYASRNTQTYYPAAFEMFAGRSSSAAWIADTMRTAVGGASAAGILGIDAQNLFPMLNNLVFAHRARSEEDRATADPRDPSPDTELEWFPKAGIARRRTERYDALLGVTKGGVIKVYDREKRRLALSDCGFAGRRADGKVVSSQQQDGAKAVEIGEDRIVIEGGFYEVSRPRMSPLRFMAFRLFSLTAGRFPGFGRWLKRYLVKVLIYRKREVRLTLRRTVEFLPDAVRIRDEIGGPDGPKIETLTRAPVFTTIHMGSSRYFIEGELHAGTETEVDTAGLQAGVTLTREVRFDDGGP